MNPEARRKPATKRVAVTIDLTQNVPWHFDCYRGIRLYGMERGWALVLNPVLVGLGHASIAAEYDGVVGRISGEVAAAAKAKGVPVVNHWAGSPAKDVPRVCPDVEAGGRLMVDHLVSHGFRHLAFVGVEGRPIDDDIRILSDAAKVHGIEPPERVVLPLGFGADRAPMIQAEEWMAGLMRRMTGPTGVIVQDANVACYFAHACHETELRVPEDIGIVVRDAVDLVVENAVPRLSSVEYDYHAVGYEAAGMLEALMQGKPVDLPHRLLPPKQIVVRESTVVRQAEAPVEPKPVR